MVNTLNATPVRTRIIGIDPGLSGAIAALDLDAPGGPVRDLTVFDMPVIRDRGKGRGRVDPASLIRLLDQLHAPALLDGADVRAVIELVAPRPGEGVVASFSFGRTLGAIETAVAASRLPSHGVTPQQWKRQMRITSAAKDAAVAQADRLLPRYAQVWRGPRGGKLDGRAEAALLALWGSTYT